MLDSIVIDEEYRKNVEGVIRNACKCHHFLSRAALWNRIYGALEEAARAAGTESRYGKALLCAEEYLIQKNNHRPFFDKAGIQDKQAKQDKQKKPYKAIYGWAVASNPDNIPMPTYQ